MRQDHKHSEGKKQQYSKTHTVQTCPTRVVITKAKHMTTDPVNNSKVTRRGTTTRDTNKGIKGNRTYKKARNI